jgi:hypothetical protein
MHVSEIINNNDKKRLIKAGFDSSFSRATPRVLQSKTKSLQELLAIGGGSGINQNDLDEIDDDLNKSEEDEINENNEIPDDIL